MKNSQLNQLSDQVLVKYDKVKTNNNSNGNNKISQAQQPIQGVNKRESKTIKTQLQKHREELELLELQIQQEQRNGLGRIQNNNSMIEDRKVGSSLSRQPLSTNNQSNLSSRNQLQGLDKQRQMNFSPIKGITNNNNIQVPSILNQSKPLGIRLSQAGQDILLPSKNKISATMDDTSILQRNYANSQAGIRSNEQPLKYPMYSGSQSPPVFRPSINNQFTQQYQLNNNEVYPGKNESYQQIQNSLGIQEQNKNKFKYNTDQQYSRGNKGNNSTIPLESRENAYYNLIGNPSTNHYVNSQMSLQNGKQQNQLQQKGQLSSPEISTLPHYLKDLSIIKLPNEDEVHFDELNVLAESHLVDKYCEFLNNDNDLFYLEGNFSRLYSSSIQSYFDSEQKDSNAFKGALAVCFDTQNPQADYKFIHPNYKVSLKKIANNPMIYAGLASQSNSTHSNNQDTINQSRMLSNSKLNTPHSHSEQNSQFGQSNNLNNFLSNKQNSQEQDAISNQNFQLGSRDGVKGTSSHGINKSNQISRAHTNSTNTNQSFFGRKFNFQIPQITGADLMSELQRIQQEYRTHKVFTYKIFIVTKFKVRIDLGFIQISFNMNTPNSQKPYSQCIIHRLFISRIYRKLNYAHFIYLQVYNFLFATYPNLEKVSITLSNLSQQYLKFNQSIGFRLENIKSTGEQNTLSQQIRLLLKRSDFAQILTHIQSKKFIEKPGLDNPVFGIQNKMPSNNLIPSF